MAPSYEASPIVSTIWSIFRFLLGKSYGVGGGVDNIIRVNFK